MLITPFVVGDLQLGLPLEAVERVERIVALTPLPGAPSVVRGIVNARGMIIPVVDVRERLSLPERAPCPTDQLLLARTRTRHVAFLADAVLPPLEIRESALVSSVQGLAQHSSIKGIAALEHGLLYIHDADAFLSLEEDRTLQAALDKWVDGEPPPNA